MNNPGASLENSPAVKLWKLRFLFKPELGSSALPGSPLGQPPPGVSGPYMIMTCRTLLKALMSGIMEQRFPRAPRTREIDIFKTREETRVTFEEPFALRLHRDTVRRIAYMLHSANGAASRRRSRWSMRGCVPNVASTAVWTRRSRVGLLKKRRDYIESCGLTNPRCYFT